MRKKSLFLVMIAISILLSACGEAEDVYVKNVEEVISNIGEVSLDSKPEIEEAESLYDSLTEEEKENVDNYNELVKAEAQYTALNMALDLKEEIETFNEDFSAFRMERAYEKADAILEEYNAIKEDDELYSAFVATMGEDMQFLYDLSDIQENIKDNCINGTWFAKLELIVSEEILEEKITDSAYTVIFPDREACKQAFKEYKDYLSDYAKISNLAPWEFKISYSGIDLDVSWDEEEDGYYILVSISDSPESSTSKSSSHKCEECSKEGNHEIISPFSGQKEYYCDEHYKEMTELLGSMGFDAGSSTSRSDSGSASTSSHTCEVCSKKATHEITSPFSGQKEYYCDEHYKEMSEILGSMLLQ